MDTIEYFARELAEYTGVDADVDDVRAYLHELIESDYDSESYGELTNGERFRRVDAPYG